MVDKPEKYTIREMKQALVNGIRPFVRIVGYWWCDHCHKYHWISVKRYSKRLDVFATIEICSLGVRKGKTP